MKLATFHRRGRVSAGLVIPGGIVDFSRLPRSRRVPPRMRDLIAAGMIKGP